MSHPAQPSHNTPDAQSHVQGQSQSQGQSQDRAQQTRSHSTIRRLFAHAGNARWIYAAALGLMIIDAACQTAVPLFFRTILNGLQTDPGSFMSDAFGSILMWAAILAAIFIPSAYFGHVFASIAVARLMHRLRCSLYRHVQALSADFHQRQRIGESSSRMNGDLDQAGTALGVAIGLVWALVSVVQAIIMMVWIDGPLSVLFLAQFALVAWLTIRCVPVIKRISRGVRDRSGETSAVVTEMLGVQTLIKSFTYEKNAGDQVEYSATNLRRAHERLAWHQYLYNDGMQLLLKFIAPFSLLFIGGWLVAEGRLLIGDLVAFWGYWILLAHGLGLIGNFLSNVMMGVAAAERVFEWLDEQPGVADSPHAIELTTARGELRFTDVTFTYRMIHLALLMPQTLMPLMTDLVSAVTATARRNHQLFRIAISTSKLVRPSLW